MLMVVVIGVVMRMVVVVAVFAVFFMEMFVVVHEVPSFLSGAADLFCTPFHLCGS